MAQLKAGTPRAKSFEAGKDGYYSLRLRIGSRDDKRILDRAAKFEGRSVNSWAVRLLMKEARKIDQKRIAALNGADDVEGASADA